MVEFIDIPNELLYIIFNESNNLLNISNTCKLFNSLNLLENKYYLYNENLDKKCIITFDTNLIKNYQKIIGLRVLNENDSFNNINNFINLKYLEYLTPGI